MKNKGLGELPSEPRPREWTPQEAPSGGFYFRLLENSDPEERLEEAALWKALYDEFGDAIAPIGERAPYPASGTVYGRPRRSDWRKPLAYWDDPAFRKEAQRQFCISTFEGLDEAVHDLHAEGFGAFIKSTKDKHAIFRVPVGQDPSDVIGDFAYSFIDGGPLLMVQQLCDVYHEWRFFCVGRKIVTYTPNAVHLTPIDYPSQYSFRRPSDRHHEGAASAVAPALYNVAERIAETMATEDAVIDCAYINGRPGCVELNPLIIGGVGLFASDVRALARAVFERDAPHGGHVAATHSASTSQEAKKPNDQ